MLEVNNLLKNYTSTARNSNNHVYDGFFYVFFLKKLVIILWVPKIPTEKIKKNRQNNYMIFLCVPIHTEKLQLFCGFL